MNLEELYKSFSTNKDCKELLLQSHWFASFADFDPKTGETLPMSLNKALSRISTRQPSKFVKDRLWLLASHSEESARRLMKALSEEPRREPAYLPIRQVRELDTASFIALSRRPGRNIREKLADKPYMQAVRHFQSIDVPENRLLKTYLMQLADALELRKKYLKDKEVDNYLQTIYRWLNEDEIKEISLWENLTPNNALLSHRDYRRVWNSWRWLQSLEDDIEKDFAHLDERRETKSKGESLSKRYASGNTVFADMPILVDYNLFHITPWDASLPTLQTSGVSHDKDFFETREPVCLDLTQLQPVFATPSQSGRLNDNFFWQRWSNGETSVDLELFDSDAVYARRGDSLTVTCSDMFFFKTKNEDEGSARAQEALNQASRAFSIRLREHFHNGHMIWLTPDSLNDFELELVRRNINSGFSQAEPLPCSVAAVFEHINYEKITRDGYKVAVVERINGKAYLTEMVARYDEDLSKALPVTHGYIWEKGTSELLSQNVEVDKVKTSLYLLDGAGNWTQDINPYGVSHKTNQDTLMSYEGYDCAIWLNGRPVQGGIKLYQLQSQVKDIPLWRNHIPELMTKVMMNGFYQPFYFVGKDVTVQPIRGKAVRINVPEEFTLPKGKKAYRLPLLQGANEEALEYEAKLVSKDFPYAEDVKCRLNMTYTYGADDPYKLVFEPLNKKYKHVNVIWQLKEDIEVDDAPAPGFPSPLSWQELKNNYNPVKKKNTDMLDWCLNSTSRIMRTLNGYRDKPVSVDVTSVWKTNSKGNQFTFGETESGDSVYISEFAFDKGFYLSKVHPGVTLYALIDRSKPGKYSTIKAALTPSDLAVGVCIAIRKSMYVPYIKTWAAGNTISDCECPEDFRVGAQKALSEIDEAIGFRHLPPNVKAELCMLLSCATKDLNAVQTKTLIEGCNSGALREKGIGFAVSSLSKQWQYSMLSDCMTKPKKQTLTIFAHAAWRNMSFVLKLPYDIAFNIVHILSEEMERLTSAKSLSEDDAEYLTRCLELLLALLRTRDSDNDDCHKMLQPSSELAKKFAQLIESLNVRFSETPIKISSRVSLDLTGKSADDNTPDLLFALQMYLTGDDASSAIRVTGIVEDDE